MSSVPQASMPGQNSEGAGTKKNYTSIQSAFKKVRDVYFRLVCDSTVESKSKMLWNVVKMV